MTALYYFLAAAIVAAPFVALGDLLSNRRWRLRRASSRSDRTIRATYGPGYGLLGWEEEWVWVVANLSRLQKLAKEKQARDLVFAVRRLRKGILNYGVQAQSAAVAMTKFKEAFERMSDAQH